MESALGTDISDLFKLQAVNFIQVQLTSIKLKWNYSGEITVRKSTTKGT